MTPLEHCIHIAQIAWQLLKKEFFKRVEVQWKWLYDIVSAADIASEQTIIKYLTLHFPNYSMIAEESWSINRSSEYTRYIDPLDWTSNFVTWNPYFSVSIALAYKWKIILWVVYSPILNETFTAQLWSGSFCNWEKMKVDSLTNISQSLVAWVYGATENRINPSLKTLEKLILKSRKVVTNFSPALDLCNISRGKLHAFVDIWTTPEDHAAWSLILSEAWGFIVEYDWWEWNIATEGIIACCNRTLLKQIVTLIL